MKAMNDYDVAVFRTKLNKFYLEAEEFLKNAPDESECSKAENEFYAELANLVNVFPDFLNDIGADMPNTQIDFLYRDASNYKKWNTVIVKGKMTDDMIESIIDSLEDGEYFIPEQVGLPVERFENFTEDDHMYCELDKFGFSYVADAPTEDLDIETLCNRFKECKGKWDPTIGMP